MAVLRCLCRCALRSLIALFVVVTTAWWFENWRGARAWDEAKARAEAAGVSLKQVDYVGAGIPDEENLLRHPVFAEEFNKPDDERLRGWDSLVDKRWRPARSVWPCPSNGTALSFLNYLPEASSEEKAMKRLLELSGDFEERLDRLAEVILKMPHHHLFSESIVETGRFEVASRDLIAYYAFVDCFFDSGAVAIRSGDSSKALERVKVLDDLSSRFDGPYFSGVGAFLVYQYGLIWEGLRLHAWEIDQLKAIRDLVARQSFDEVFAQAIRFRAALFSDYLNEATDEEILGPPYPDEISIRWVWMNGPAGWHDLRKAYALSGYLDLLEILEAHDVERLIQVDREMDVGLLSPLNPVAFVSGSCCQSFLALGQRGWEAETRKRLVLIALEAEIILKQQGAYPKTLDEMDLGFPVVDMTDPQGRRLGYELDPNGRPQIWSLYQEELGTNHHESLRWQFWFEEQK